MKEPDWDTMDQTALLKAIAARSYATANHLRRIETISGGILGVLIVIGWKAFGYF